MLTVLTSVTTGTALTRELVKLLQKREAKKRGNGVLRLTGKSCYGLLPLKEPAQSAAAERFLLPNSGEGESHAGRTRTEARFDPRSSNLSVCRIGIVLKRFWLISFMARRVSQGRGMPKFVTPRGDNALFPPLCTGGIRLVFFFS